MNITGYNVNEVWQIMILNIKDLVKNSNAVVNTRNGIAYRFPGVVVLEYKNPIERVLFDPIRNCNPFFHLFESLWMLSGSKCVFVPQFFNSRMSEYSDNGMELHGAYGHRWFNHFGFNQVEDVINMLRNDKHSRRAVISMWDPRADLYVDSKDIPCNTQIQFDIQENKLYMKVFNRSNDAIWGALGANVVHLSFLQEYIANMLDVDVGNYHQISCNMHVYKEVWDKYKFPDGISDLNPYDFYKLPTIKLVNNKEKFEDDLRHYMNWLTSCIQKFISLKDEDIARTNIFVYPPMTHNDFFHEICTPLVMSYAAYKDNNLKQAKFLAGQCAPSDWKFACKEWLNRKKIR